MEEPKEERPKGTISGFEAMQRNRKERRRIGKINGKQIRGINFPFTKPNQEQNV